MKNEKSIDRNHNLERRNLEDTRREETRRLLDKTNVFSAREREIVPVVFLVVLTIVITTSDPHFSRGITFPAGECKFQRRAGSGARGIQEDKLYRGERHIIYVASRIITVSTDRPRSV